jgi:hypothetical protein
MSATPDTTAICPSNASSMGRESSAGNAPQSSNVTRYIPAKWYGPTVHATLCQSAIASPDLHAPYSFYNDTFNSQDPNGTGRFSVNENGKWGFELWDRTSLSHVCRPDLIGDGIFKPQSTEGDVGRPVLIGINQQWLMIGDECSQKEVMG